MEALPEQSDRLAGLRGDTCVFSASSMAGEHSWNVNSCWVSYKFSLCAHTQYLLVSFLDVGFLAPMDNSFSNTNAAHCDHSVAYSPSTGEPLRLVAENYAAPLLLMGTQGQDSWALPVEATLPVQSLY